MASKQMLVAVVAAAALAVVFLTGLDVATEHMVGDDKGWTLNFNYTAWAETKQFVLGDTLGNHTTINPTTRRACISPIAMIHNTARSLSWFRRNLNCSPSLSCIAVFKYNSPAQNLVEVGGPDFLSCTKPANAVVLTTGGFLLALGVLAVEVRGEAPDAERGGDGLLGAERVAEHDAAANDIGREHRCHAHAAVERRR